LTFSHSALAAGHHVNRSMSQITTARENNAHIIT